MQGSSAGHARCATWARRSVARWLFPGSKSNVEDFEQGRFIESVHDGEVRFHYRGGWRERRLKRGVSTANVRWIAERLARLSPAQWRDAFRAAGAQRVGTAIRAASAAEG